MASDPPAQSSAKSTPPLVISMMTSWMGFCRSLGLRQSVAPRALAFANFSLLISTAMILEAPAALQPIKAERPTPPRPKTAQVEPGVTCIQENHVNLKQLVPHFFKGAGWGGHRNILRLRLRLSDVATLGKCIMGKWMSHWLNLENRLRAIRIINL